MPSTGNRQEGPWTVGKLVTLVSWILGARLSDFEADLGDGFFPNSSFELIVGF